MKSARESLVRSQVLDGPLPGFVGKHKVWVNAKSVKQSIQAFLSSTGKWIYNPGADFKSKEKSGKGVLEKTPVGACGGRNKPDVLEKA